MRHVAKSYGCPIPIPGPNSTYLQYQMQCLEMVWAQDPSPGLAAFALDTACIYGRLEIAQWALALDPTRDLRNRNDYLLTSAYQAGWLHIAEWLWSLYHKVTVPGPETANDLLALRTTMLLSNARHGIDLRLEQWLAAIGPPLPLDQVVLAFHAASQGNRLDLMQWLWSKYPDIPLHSQADQAHILITASREDYLEMAKWVWSVRPKDQDATQLIREAFRVACIAGHLDVMRWLRSLGEPIDYHRVNASILRDAWQHGDHDVVDFLIECTEHDPVVRYLRHGNNCYIVGAACTQHVHHIDGIAVSSMNPANEADARTVVEMALRKKSARSVADD